MTKDVSIKQLEICFVIVASFILENHPMSLVLLGLCLALCTTLVEADGKPLGVVVWHGMGKFTSLPLHAF